MVYWGVGHVIARLFPTIPPLHFTYSFTLLIFTPPLPCIYSCVGSFRGEALNPTEEEDKVIAVNSLAV